MIQCIVIESDPTSTNTMLPKEIANYTHIPSTKSLDKQNNIIITKDQINTALDHIERNKTRYALTKGTYIEIVTALMEYCILINQNEHSIYLHHIIQAQYHLWNSFNLFLHNHILGTWVIYKKSATKKYILRESVMTPIICV